MEKTKKLFSQPTKREREKAIGEMNSLSNRNKTQLTKIIPFFRPIPLPSSDDWLHSQKEIGQSFSKYAEQPRAVDTKRKKIYIVPLEKSITVEYLEKMKTFAEAFFYGIKIEILDLIDIDAEQVKFRGTPSNRQYSATQILAILNKRKPHNAFAVMGICASDIYHREEWNYVFGLASLTDHVGVFSYARYQQSFYEKSAVDDIDLLIYRSCKVMCHEITHQFSIKHCIYFHCVMNGSNSYEEAGAKPFQLCPVCLHKLQLSLRFDMTDRYARLIEAVASMKNKFFQQEIFIYKNLMVINEIEGAAKIVEGREQRKNMETKRNN